jgi:hypothetical protein
VTRTIIVRSGKKKKRKGVRINFQTQLKFRGTQRAWILANRFLLPIGGTTIFAKFLLLHIMSFSFSPSLTGTILQQFDFVYTKRRLLIFGQFALMMTNHLIIPTLLLRGGRRGFDPRQPQRTKRAFFPPLAI